MDGRAIFNFMMRRVPSCVRECLAANDLTMDDIDFFAFHQASRYMLENLARSLEISMDRVPISIRDTGNTVSSTIPILLDSLGGIDSLNGKRVLVAGFGVGLSWAATVLTFARN
jgi:3-oxoacyl-[acyl-carrier-protein] synthase-3